MNRILRQTPSLIAAISLAGAIAWGAEPTPIWAPIPGVDDGSYVPPFEQAVVGWWLFDETLGEESLGDTSGRTYIVDQSGNNNHGVRKPIGVSNDFPFYTSDVPQPYAGYANYSLNFISTLSAVQIPDYAGSGLDLSHDFTLETWVNFNTLSNVQYLISKENVGGVPSGYWIEWSSSRLRFGVNTTTSTRVVDSVDFSPTVGSWHHIAAVHDSTRRELLLYVDGVLDNTLGLGFAETVVANDEPLTFGQRGDAAYPGNLKLDEVRLSAKVVDPEDFTINAPFGPAQVILGDNAESFASTSDMFNRDGGHWYGASEMPGAAYNMSSTRGHSGTQSAELTIPNTTTAGYDGTDLGRVGIDSLLPYFDLEGRIGMSCWFSFSGLENHSTLMFPQFAIGATPHYGYAETNVVGTYYIAGAPGVFYEGGPPLTSSLDDWHYFEIVLDFNERRRVSVQIDNDLLIYGEGEDRYPLEEYFGQWTIGAKATGAGFNVRLINDHLPDTGDTTVLVDDVVFRIVRDRRGPRWANHPLALPAAVAEYGYDTSLTAQHVINGYGDPLTFRKISGPDWLTVSEAGTLRGTPGLEDLGVNQAIIEASDGARTENGTIEIAVVDADQPRDEPYPDDSPHTLGLWHMEPNEIGDGPGQLTFQDAGDAPQMSSEQARYGATSLESFGVFGPGLPNRVMVNDSQLGQWPSGDDPSLSVEAWVNFHPGALDPNEPHNFYWIIDKMQGAAGGAQGYRVTYDAPSELLSWHVGDGIQDIAIYWPQSFVAERWYHVAGTWDAETDTSHLYVDGTLVARKTSPGSRIVNDPSVRTAIANRSLDDAGSSAYAAFDGYIDEVRISDFAYAYTTPFGYCGDGTVDAEEECDDGNFDDGDGCTRRCRFFTGEVRSCQEALGKVSERYFSARLRSLQRCRAQLNKGKALFIDDAKTVPLVDPEECADERTVRRAATLGRAKARRLLAREGREVCRDEHLAALSSCADTVAGAIGIGPEDGCLFSTHDEAVDALVDEHHGRILTTDERAATLCQKAIASAVQRYAKKRTKALYGCRKSLNRGRLLYTGRDESTRITQPAECIDERRTADRIDKARKQMRRMIANESRPRCTDELLASMGTLCAASVDGLVAADGTAGCLIEGVDAASDEIVDATH